MAKTWKLKDWNGQYSNPTLPVMTRQQVNRAVEFLRSHNYPKPADCPWNECPKFRPACQLGVCNIAVGMCGDF